jgi:hypothetical protein
MFRVRLRAGSLAIKAPLREVGAHQQPRARTVVCTKNLVRFDLTTGSLNVDRNGRDDILSLEPGHLDLQAQEPT